MLGWTTKRVSKAVEEALRGAPAGPVTVVGDAALAKALAEAGRTVVAEGDGACAALVAVGDGDLSTWSSALVEGGVLVLVDRGPPAQATRRALCSALHDLEQRSVGKAVVTSGRVRRHVSR